MNRQLLLLGFIFSCGLSFGQTTDYETTSIAITSMSTSDYMKPLNVQLGIRAFNVQEQIPSIPEEKQVVVNFSENKDPDLISRPMDVKPLQIKVYGFSENGSISGVKNIAYKQAGGQNVFQAYCRSAYAGRSGGNP